MKIRNFLEKILYWEILLWLMGFLSFFPHTKNLKWSRIITKEEQIKTSKIAEIKRDGVKKRIRELYNKSWKDYKEIIREIETPEEVVEYLANFEYKDDYEVYGKKDWWASFKEFLKNKGGDCEDFGIASAALLSDNGFYPYLLICLSQSKKEFFKNGGGGHSTFLYKIKEKGKEKYGIIDHFLLIEGADSVSELLNTLNKFYDNKFKDWFVIDLKKIFPNFIDGK